MHLRGTDFLSTTDLNLELEMVCLLSLGFLETENSIILITWDTEFQDNDSKEETSKVKPGRVKCV